MFGLVLIYLVAMVVSVPVCTRLGLGALPGYLLIGLIMGQGGTNLLGAMGYSPGDVMEFSEFGIVFMLFLIGLEMNPAHIREKGKELFSLGTAQMLSAIFAICAVFFVFGLHKSLGSRALILSACVLAFSSTAIAIPALDSLGYKTTSSKERSFLILIFQDILVIPFLTILPLLAPTSGFVSSDGPAYLKILKVFIAVACIAALSWLLLKKVFKTVAELKLQELFTALTLMIVLVSSGMMHAAGVSYSFGAFLAGTMLSTSEYRFQLEADLAPFKGLLLGAFFISLGATLDWAAIMQNGGLFAAVFFSLLIVKGVSLFGIGRLLKISAADRGVMAISLAQGSEFALVLFLEMQNLKYFPPSTASAFSAAVIASMFVTPVALKFYKQYFEPKFFKKVSQEKTGEAPKNKKSDVLVAGLGRFGQGIVRLLRANRVRPTVLDFDGEQIEILKGIGLEAFYGDVSRMDLLEMAGAHDAKVLVLAIDSYETTTKIIPVIRKTFPHLKIFARAYDRIHAYQLLALGVDQVLIETSGSAFEMGRRVMEAIGFHPRSAFQAKTVFQRENEASIRRLAKEYHSSDEESFFALSRQAVLELEHMLQDDGKQSRKYGSDRGWASTVAARDPDENSM